MHCAIIHGMNEKVLRVVEFHKIIEKLGERATSAPGKELCLSLVPMRDLTDIERAQDETDAAVRFLLKNARLSFGNNRDFSGTLKSLAIGSSLSMQELLRIAAFLENVARIKAAGPEDEEDPLFDRFDCLYPLSPLKSEIRRCILDEERMADDASPELKQIRRGMQQIDGKIHAQLNRMVNVTYASYLQDNIITVRGERYCLPVRVEYKSQVRGIIHDQSSTGATLFIEPVQIVEMGNEMREYQIREKKEQERILAELSASCAGYITALSDDQKNMTELDFIFARAQFALDMEAVRPKFRKDHVIRIIKGRHPLIDRKTVVPIDLTIGEDYDMIIVTGPNTGGKTVTLKTVGLLELMGMSGLQIPAGDGSELSVFREVFADIGDEQSIEQNLSTFSSHMTSIVDILKRADKECLCLFDELGSGTDPTEGAALAISILNFMHVRGITTLATTHYAELKLFAMNTEGIVNASCEFDVETLQPTYRLLVGVPGRSNAFAIATRLGMPNYIIETAKEQMTQESKDFEEMLSELEETRLRVSKEKAETERLRADMERRNAALKKREAAIEQQRQAVLDKANEKAREILGDAKKTADRAIADLRKYGGDGSMADMERVRSSLREEANAKNAKTGIPAPARKGKGLKASDLHPGMKVRIVSMGMEGIVVSLPDKQGKLQVRCGILNSQVNLKDLEAVREGDTGSSSGSGKSGSRIKKAFAGQGPSSGNGVDISRALSVSPEINLLGMTADEAILALDKYLDDARMSHLDTVRIVHGKGTGALRNAVQNYLRRQKWISSFRMGDFGEGDAGVTIVKL